MAPIAFPFHSPIYGIYSLLHLCLPVAATQQLSSSIGFLGILKYTNNNCTLVGNNRLTRQGIKTKVKNNQCRKSCSYAQYCFLIIKEA